MARFTPSPTPPVASSSLQQSNGGVATNNTSLINNYCLPGTSSSSPSSALAMTPFHRENAINNTINNIITSTMSDGLSPLMNEAGYKEPVNGWSSSTRTKRKFDDNSGESSTDQLILYSQKQRLNRIPLIELALWPDGSVFRRCEIELPKCARRARYLCVPPETIGPKFLPITECSMAIKRTLFQLRI